MIKKLENILESVCQAEGALTYYCFPNRDWKEYVTDEEKQEWPGLVQTIKARQMRRELISALRGF